MTGGTAGRVLQAVRAVLPSTATVSHGVSGGPWVPVLVNGRLLRAYWLETGRPVGVREALARLDAELPDAFVARVMSPGAREEASRAGVGWVDETGAAELASDWLVVSREGQGHPETGRPPDAWTPAISAVAEALLLGTTPTVAATTATTGLSVGLCTRALAFFTQRGFLAAEAPRGRRSARRLVETDRLLEEYAVAVTSFRRIELRVGILWRDPVATVADLGRRWDLAGTGWAATGALAAAAVAPYLTDIGTGEVLVAGETRSALRIAADQVSARPMEGGRLILRLFPSAATARLSARANGLRVAPWPRIYADVRTVGVRGEDAAEHLLEVMNGRGAFPHQGSSTGR